MTDLAEARGIDPMKYVLGLGQSEMAVSSPCEDSVVLAIEAAKQAIDNFGIDASSIGLVVVGTETPIDHSKPVASYVHEFLELSQECRVVEMKHACYGAMAGVSMATDWILSGRNKQKKALVIATDIAYYGVNTPGEPTQGAGAVAMVISEQPRLVEFEIEFQGYYAKQVMDFWRPLYKKEAIADGHYSIDCYLNALGDSYQMYKNQYFEKNDKIDNNFNKIFSASLYHVPFVKMAQKAHIMLLGQDWGMQPARDSEEFQTAKNDYQLRVAPYLKLNARIGNIYTGSLFLSLYNFLADASESMTGKSISLFGYGSGCSAEFISAKILKFDKRLLDYKDRLKKRRKLDIVSYENLQELWKNTGNKDGVFNDEWELDRQFIYLGSEDHKRQYQNKFKA